MLLSRSLAISALVVSLCGTTPGQTPMNGAPRANRQAPRTVLDVLMTMPWDVAKDGPLVAPVPMEMASGTSLDALERRKTTIGGLTAIVPKTMATIDSRFSTAPNLYEGLPQEAKVLYLLRSLSPGQWTKATTDGLSLDDCQGEQRAVFDSILPNPLRYTMGTIGDGRSISTPGGPEATKTLTGAERERVKIRILRHLQLHVSLANDGGWTGTETDEDTKPGMKMPYLLNDKDARFGHKVIVRSPNVPRKSHLDLSDPRLGASIPLKSTETIRQLLTRIGAATGYGLYADPNYERRMMVERGASATARDLLAAVSLGVAGTYRRVGGSYVLTADLEGVGAHMARVLVWEDALQKVVDARSREWRLQIAKGGGFGKIPFRSPAYEGLTEAERANLDTNDHPNSRPTFIPLDRASKPVQDAIRNYQHGNNIDRERVGIASSIRYQLLLPGVGRAWWQGWLGSTEEYNSKPYTWAPPNPPPVAMPLDSKGIAGLVLHADSPAEAKAHIARAARVGVDEIWLETRNPSTLTAAVEAGAASGVRVCLALRPWEVPANANLRDPDRTITGERGRTLDAAKRTIEPWWNFWQDIQAFETPTRELMAPLDPATAPTIARLAQLAGTPGLAKVVVLDLYPTGYGKAESFTSGSYWYSNALDFYLAYGYTEAMREAHLKKEGVDPLDLGTQAVHSELNFGPVWGESFWSPQGFDKWQKAKGEWSRARAVALAQSLLRANSSCPILMPGEPPTNHLPPPATAYLYRWPGTPDLPAAPQDFGGGTVPDAAEFRVLDLVDDRDPEQRNRVASLLKGMLDKPTKPVVLDLSSIPAARVETVLKRWLKDR